MNLVKISTKSANKRRFSNLVIIFAFLNLSFLIEAQSKSNMEAIEIGSVKANAYNDILKNQVEREVSFHTNTSTSKKGKVGTLSFCSKEFIYQVCVELTKNRRIQLAGLIQKYIDWETKAKTKGDKLEKKIGEIGTPNVFVYSQASSFISDSSGKLSLIFFSQNSKLHQLVFSYPKYTSASNEYINHQPDTLYFDLEHAKAFKSLLDETFLGSKVEAFYKKKADTDKEYK